MTEHEFRELVKRMMGAAHCPFPLVLRYRRMSELLAKAELPSVQSSQVVALMIAMHEGVPTR